MLRPAQVEDLQRSSDEHEERASVLEKRSAELEQQNAQLRALLAEARADGRALSAKLDAMEQLRVLVSQAAASVAAGALAAGPAPPRTEPEQP